MKVFFVESKINLILKKHFKKRTSNIESIRKSLNIMLNEKNLNTLIKKLKKFKRDVVYEIVYCMKKHFKNSVDDDNLLLKEEHKMKKKRKTLKNEIKSLKKSHKKKLSKLYERIDVFKNVIKKSTSSKIFSKSKRSMKISDSSLFSDEKTMLVFQWISRMKNKLLIIANHFFSEKIKIIYIKSRTKNNALKHLKLRMRKNAFYSFRTSDEMLNAIKMIFDDFNQKLTIIKKFRILRMNDKNFHTFWAKFQRIIFNFNYDDKTLIIEMIHKFHSIFQRLIAVEFQIENVYELTKQCQRIYERNIQVDKSKRIVNKINMQNQRRIRTFDVVAFFAFALTTFASVFFFR